MLDRKGFALVDAETAVTDLHEEDVVSTDFYDVRYGIGGRDDKQPWRCPARGDPPADMGGGRTDVAMIVGLPCLGQEEAGPASVGGTSGFVQSTDATARSFVNELSTRRRVTTLFENRQSAFHGVQENFVNTSAGNLTFLVRDPVRVGGMPIVMGRVYDSDLGADGDVARDFGPGWKLAVRESLATRGTRLIYTDARTPRIPPMPSMSATTSSSSRRSRHLRRCRRGGCTRHGLWASLSCSPAIRCGTS